jgi:uncharacterized protein YbbC (DUF1343 family)
LRESLAVFTGFPDSFVILRSFFNFTENKETMKNLIILTLLTVMAVAACSAGETDATHLVNRGGWLAGGMKCDLTVIRCENYTHETMYELLVIPSPNLPNMNSVYLYPSLCYAEGTVLSCGRGTEFPFQVLGAPKIPDTGFSFTPQPSFGSFSPKYSDQTCYGFDLRNALAEGHVPKPEMNIGWIIDAYIAYPEKESFFTGYFDTLAGSNTLREQIMQGMTVEEIRAT